MNEQKIAPVLVKDIEQMALDAGAEIARRPMYGRRISFAPHQLIHFLGLHEQAVLARVGAVRDQALEEAAELLGKYRTLCVDLGRGDGYHLGRIDDAIRALKSTPAAAVADAKPVAYWVEIDGTVRRPTLSKSDSIYLRQLGATVRPLVFAPQSSSNTGPLAAVERDAKRYRWLKERNSGPIGIVAWHRDAEKETVLVESMADETIDAAIAASKEGASHGEG